MINKFMEVCSNYPVDYESLREMLIQGFDINSKVNEEDESISILSETIKMWKCSDSTNIDDAKEELYKLTVFFIDNGFDVKKYGKVCLRNLCWSHIDKYILHIAELLLDYGAETSNKSYDNDKNDVIDAIEWKLGDWVIGTGRTANTMTAYYNMIEAYERGEEYHGIRSFESCIGKTITSIHKISFTEEEMTFDKTHAKEFSGGLIIWCGNVPLFVSNSAQLYVDPRIINKIINSIDISEQYNELIGLTIKDLYYIDGSDGVCLLSFEDTDIQLFINNIWRSVQDIQYIVVNIIKESNFSNYDLSNIQEVYIPAGTIYSYKTTEYKKKYTIIKCKHTSYLVYSIGKSYRAHRIMIIDVNNWFDYNRMDRIKIEKPVLGGYLQRKNKTLRGISINSLDKQLVIRTDIFDKIIILLVDKDKYNEREICYIVGQYKLEFEEASFR